MKSLYVSLYIHIYIYFSCNTKTVLYMIDLYYYTVILHSYLSQSSQLLLLRHLQQLGINIKSNQVCSDLQKEHYPWTIQHPLWPWWFLAMPCKSPTAFLLSFRLMLCSSVTPPVGCTQWMEPAAQHCIQAVICRMNASNSGDTVV